MKEKLKVNVGIAILISSIICALIVLTIIFFPVIINLGIKTIEGTNSQTKINKNIFIKVPRNSDADYEIINTEIADDKFFDDGIDPERGISNAFVKSKEEFETVISKCSKRDILREGNLSEGYKPEDVLLYINGMPALEYFNDTFFENHNLIIQMNGKSYGGYHSNIASITKDGNVITMNIEETYATYGSELVSSIYLKFVPVDKSIEKAEFIIYVRNFLDIYNWNLQKVLIAIIVLWIVVSSITVIISSLIVIIRGKIRNKEKVETK